MFKSKHCGWTWELRRTPFGGGNPLDSVSNALGTDGSGGGALGALASIDPGPAIGSGLASADKFMTNLTPYGWALPAALVAAYFTGGGSLAAEGAAEAGAATAGEAAATSAATEAGTAAYSEAIAAGASETEATAAANAAAESSLASTTGTAAETGYGGASSVGNLQPAVSGEIGAGTSSGTFGSLNPGLPAAGSTGGAGSLSAQLAPGTVMGTGAAGGGAIGSTYAAGANGLPATDFFGNYIPASSINTGGVPNTVTGTSITSDTLNTLNNVKKGTDAANKLSQLLNQGAASGLSSSLGKLAAGQNASPEALPNLVRGNQNPFTYTQQQPIQNAQPMDLSSLSKLLKQG